MADEDVMRKIRLSHVDGTGDNSKANRLLKTFIQWCKTVNENPDDSQPVHDTMLALLAKTEFSLAQLNTKMTDLKKTNHQAVLDVFKKEIESSKEHNKGADSAGNKKLNSEVNNLIAINKELDKKISLIQKELDELNLTTSQLPQTQDQPSTANKGEMK